MPPADAGSCHIFVENEGLTALATIMPPTFVGSEFRSPSVFAPFGATPRQVGSPIADLTMLRCLLIMLTRRNKVLPMPAGVLEYRHVAAYSDLYAHEFTGSHGRHAPGNGDGGAGARAAGARAGSSGR